jgi:asparagine synthase (glutamine-hydrolysing)
VTTILAVIDVGANLPDERLLRRSLGDADLPGVKRVAVHFEPGVALGISQPASTDAPTEMAAGFAIDERYVALVDGTFYYLEDLSARLGERLDRSTTRGRLVLNAFRRFGPACVDHLEGDYSFAIWDRHTREVFCARDFTGRRPLFLAPWSGGLVVSSSLDSIAALPGFHAEVNPAVVGADAAGLFFAVDDETCMRGVSSLRAGDAVRWQRGKQIVTERYWQPQPTAESLSFSDAAVVLRDLLAEAVSQRMADRAPTAVWMSGGRDSTAVFGAGMHALAVENREASLRPVSRSHPPDDSGREDEAIEEVARHWQATPTWIDAKAVSLFSEMRGRDRWSAESFAQPFESLARALAKASRSCGASVALDGYGGDFLFQVSRAYLADVLTEGRPVAAMREWRAMDRGRVGISGFAQYALQPALPRWARRALGSSWAARRIRGPMQRPIAPWIEPGFARKQDLTARSVALGPDLQPGTTAVQRETEFYLHHQFFPRVNARMTRFALEHGVELRSPLLDRRVVQFALSRPRAERNAAGDTKRLLRASMRGLLPESVLAPRVGKSGTLTTYFAEQMWKDGLNRLQKMLPARELESLGIVRPQALAAAVDQYRALGHRYPHVESLFCTLQAETWLRSRESSRRDHQRTPRVESA